MTQLETAIKIINQANKFLVKKYRVFGVPAARLKKNNEITTDVDIAANDLIIKKLKKYFPKEKIISEENKQNKTAPDAWYIDPLDGTTNFAFGLRDFSVCLARTKNNDVESGVVGVPMADEIFWAKKNSAAFLNGKKITVSKRKPTDTHLMILFCGGHSPKGKKRLSLIIKKIENIKIHARIFASAGLELSSVACGRADGCALTEIHPWDVLAGIALVRSAGGKVTNFKGEEWKISDSTLIASNGLIHKKLLNLV
ncbi:MAG: inositol monophosphatase [Patescibacteria group bacterium]|nr:inositol monophosphatase [Patescibacteria group bacterium]